jgi:hypothetical protein
MAYLGAGVGKALSSESLVVYFDCLGDLDAATLMTAAKRVMMEHRYANFPSIAELRDAASMTVRGAVAELSPAKAWDMASRLACDVDPEVEGQFERKAKGLPTLVVEAIRVFGIRQLCFGTEPASVQRAQFIKCYEQLADADRKRALYPKPLVQAIEGRDQRPALPAPVMKALVGVGLPTAPTAAASGT